MPDQLNKSFGSKLTRVRAYSKEVGNEGNWVGKRREGCHRNVEGTLTDNVNFMAGNLTSKCAASWKVVTAVANGDLNQKFCA